MLKITLTLTLTLTYTRPRMFDRFSVVTIATPFRFFFCGARRYRFNRRERFSGGGFAVVFICFSAAAAAQLTSH